jgi:hypothetical protein
MNPNSIEISRNMMFMLDEGGHGRDCNILKTFEDAKEQITHWQKTFSFDRDEAIVMVLGYFKDEPAGEEITHKSTMIARHLLKITTLAPRNVESLDCHILHVQEIALILRAAYELGRASVY